MPEIRNENDLERWLNGISNEEERRRVAVAIASRAAMRVLPVIEKWLSADEDEAIAITLPTFRAIAASRLAAVRSSRDTEVRRAADVAARAARAAARMAADGPFSAPGAPSYATHSAAYTADAASLAAKTTKNTSSAPYAAAGAASAVYIAADPSYEKSSIAETIAWNALSQDVSFYEKGSLEALLNAPLWHDEIPGWVQDLWASMKQRLLAREGEHWEVWTNWYDVRLDPSKEIPCYNPPIPELERARVLIPEDLWEQGPAAVNAEIRRLIEEHECSRVDDPPPIPPQQPATIEVEWQEERLVLRKRPLQADMDDYLLQAALQALRQQLRETIDTLQRDQSANAIDSRIIEELRKVRELIPEETPIDKSDGIQLALQVAELKAYFGGMSQDEAQGWPEVLRQKVATQIETLHSLLARFRIWEELPSTEAEELGEEAEENATKLGDGIAQDLEELGPDIVDPAIAQRLREMVERLREAMRDGSQRIGAAVKLRTSDLRQSINNILKKAGAWLLRKARILGRAFDGQLNKELEKTGKALAKMLGRAMRWGMLSGASAVGTHWLGWLEPVVNWLKQFLSNLF